MFTGDADSLLRFLQFYDFTFPRSIFRSKIFEANLLLTVVFFLYIAAKLMQIYWLWAFMHRCSFQNSVWAKIRRKKNPNQIRLDFEP